MLAPRSIRADLLILLALSAVACFLGLTTHGLTNWQEAQRALVARDMWEHGEWIVPTVRGQPYLAKPPLIYWCQLGLAALTRSAPGELHLRLTVAIAATLGVLATYLAGRRILAPDAPSAEGPAASLAPKDAHWHEHAAFWGAAFLATGVLAVRSGRIGELDVLLIPPTVIAIGAIDAAWRSHRTRGRTSYPAVLLACLCAGAAALVKGPPALLAIGLGAYGGIALQHAAMPSARARDRIALAGAAVAVLASVALLAPKVVSATDAAGLAFIAASLGFLVWLLVRLLDPARFPAFFVALARTHPVGVLLAGALALWLWSRAVVARIGPEAVASAVRAETEDNLRLLVLESPLNNLEAAAYGVGLGSIAAIIAVVWLIKDRPRFSPGMRTVIAWCLLGLIAFSLLGKGVPRYLTPIWPGIALLGGMWAASGIRDLPRGRGLARVLAVSVALLALGQGVWYGYGREALNPERSPRDFAADLLAASGDSPIASLDVWHPALEFYLGRPVPCYWDVDPDGNPLGPQPPIAELVRDIRRSGEPWTIVCRAAERGERRPPIERLRARGLHAEQIPLAHPFVVGNGKTEVIAVRISAGGA